MINRALRWAEIMYLHHLWRYLPVLYYSVSTEHSCSEHWAPKMLCPIISTNVSFDGISINRILHQLIVELVVRNQDTHPVFRSSWIRYEVNHPRCLESGQWSICLENGHWIEVWGTYHCTLYTECTRLSSCSTCNTSSANALPKFSIQLHLEKFMPARREHLWKFVKRFNPLFVQSSGSLWSTISVFPWPPSCSPWGSCLSGFVINNIRTNTFTYNTCMTNQ